MRTPDQTIRDLVELSCHGGKPGHLTARAVRAIRLLPTARIERLEDFVFVLRNLCDAELLERQGR